MGENKKLEPANKKLKGFDESVYVPQVFMYTELSI